MELGHREGSRMDVEEPLERRTVSWRWHGAQEMHCGDQDLWGIHHRQPSEAWLESSSLYYLVAHGKICNPRSWSEQYIYSGYSCPLLHRNSRWGDSSMSSLDSSLCPGPIIEFGVAWLTSGVRLIIFCANQTIIKIWNFKLWNFNFRKLKFQYSNIETSIFEDWNLSIPKLKPKNLSIWIKSTVNRRWIVSM